MNVIVIERYTHSELLKTVELVKRSLLDILHIKLFLLPHHIMIILCRYRKFTYSSLKCPKKFWAACSRKCYIIHMFTVFFLENG